MAVILIALTEQTKVVIFTFDQAGEDIGVFKCNVITKKSYHKKGTQYIHVAYAFKKKKHFKSTQHCFPVSTDTKPQMFVSVPVVKKVYRCIPKRCQDVKDFKELHPFTWRPDN